MKVITARNVNQALIDGLWHLSTDGVVRDSRNGRVIVSKTPVTTAYKNPRERILWSHDRDANPYLHFLESVWMLAGRNDVAFPSFLAPNMKNYSDNGKTLNGAYGYRWFEHFGFDQLKLIVDELKRDPESRRCNLQMWDGNGELKQAMPDFPEYSKDVCCNLSVVFAINYEGKLDITVFNRSNDILWGAYGANAVHFSILQEFTAAFIGVEVGNYYQVSNNYHLYLDLYPQIMNKFVYFDSENKMRPLTTSAEDFDEYSQGFVTPSTLFDAQDISNGYEQTLSNIQSFFDPFDKVKRESCSSDKSYYETLLGKLLIAEQSNTKIVRISWLMIVSFLYYKLSNKEMAISYARLIQDEENCQDWSTACFDWLNRRKWKTEETV